MCLSVPGKVIAIQEDMALVDVGGTTINVGIQLLEHVIPGDYVLVHSGFALQIISREDAEVQLELIKAMRK
ncbi:MAG: HypC/HybG/HupF family hydrogenase formation chaperone [Bacteroidales bacterium]|nr:HypC/HybG/HupF family hydrogenase formation chaperone [Bacteroidales bacterium]MDZ4203798.1 HypC/HybG/HupF family hydrogenase formation chaperone [Bacteroidales bacterium]